MINRRNVITGGASLLAAPALLSAGAGAQSEYPSGQFKFYSMFPPGAGADTKIRFFAARLAAKTGATAVVESRPGAFGNIATEAAVRSKPDGHTIYVCPSSSMLVANRFIFKKLNFDPINDFEHITTLHIFAFALIVRADRFKNVAELTAYLKEKGDKASYGTLATPGLVSAEIYKAKFGLQTVVVNYKDQGPLINDLMAGTIDFTFIDPITVAGPLREGKMRGLCMASAEPLENIPGIPGAREAGIPDLNIRNFWSVHVPAKTPKPICEKLETWFNEIAVEPETLKFNKDTGCDLLKGNSKMLRELLETETKNWAEYVKLAKIEPV